MLKGVGQSQVVVSFCWQAKVAIHYGGCGPSKNSCEASQVRPVLGDGQLSIQGYLEKFENLINTVKNISLGDKLVFLCYIIKKSLSTDKLGNHHITSSDLYF